MKFDAIEIAISEEVKVMVMLMSLFNNYQTLITSLESSKIEDWKWQNVSPKLLNEELMKKEKIETSQVSGKIALIVTPKVGQKG
jgi:hypothetical protein